MLRKSEGLNECESIKLSRLSVVPHMVGLQSGGHYHWSHFTDEQTEAEKR